MAWLSVILQTATRGYNVLMMIVDLRIVKTLAVGLFVYNTFVALTFSAIKP